MEKLLLALEDEVGQASSVLQTFLAFEKTSSVALQQLQQLFHPISFHSLPQVHGYVAQEALDEESVDDPLVVSMTSLTSHVTGYPWVRHGASYDSIDCVDHGEGRAYPAEGGEHLLEFLFIGTCRCADDGIVKVVVEGEHRTRHGENQ